MKRTPIIWYLFTPFAMLIVLAAAADAWFARRPMRLVEAALVGVVALPICAMMSRRLVRPIEAITLGAARYAQGDLSHRIAPMAVSELADLSTAMNRMAENIGRRLDTVVEQRNETQAVLSSMMEGVVAIDMEERVMHMNQAAAQMLDQEAEKVSNRTILEIARNRDLHAIVRRTLITGLSTEGDIVLNTRNDRILNIRCSTLKNAVGERIGALLVVDDVTRLRRLENMRKDFTANASHEIKTPLTAIRGFVETLHQGAVDDPGEAHRFLGIIHKHVVRLSSVIDDLMKLAQLEHDGAGERLKTEPVLLRVVLDNTIQLCAHKASQKKIAIELDCPNDLRAEMDPALMGQAFMNLLDNAVKYSPAEETIAIGGRRHNGRIRISFQDHGQGIAKQHLTRLFERFYRVDTARSREMGGTGLGLAIVKHIVQVHGGSVGVESTLGRGSTFFIDLTAAE